VILIDLVEDLLKTVNNSNIHVDRKIRIGCLNVNGTGDDNYRYQMIVKIFQNIYLVILDVIIHQIKSMVYYIKVELIKKLEYMIRLVVIILRNMVGVDEVTKYNKIFR